VLLARVEVSARRGRLISDSAKVVGGICDGKEQDVVGWYSDSGRIHRSQTCTGQDPFQKETGSWPVLGLGCGCKAPHCMRGCRLSFLRERTFFPLCRSLPLFCGRLLAWVTGACREKSSVELSSNSAEHECLSEVLQVARWLKCGRFIVVHHLAVRVGVEPPQTPDAQSARAARTQRMSNLSNGAAC
jgi:hypothetical protein